MMKLKVGQKVWWNDPDAGESSGEYKILKLYNNNREEVRCRNFHDEDDVEILIGNGSSEAAVYACELETETVVVFRKYKDGQIIALFPEDKWNVERTEVTSYMHLGQHGGANYRHVINCTSVAKPEEYADLLAELKQVGYNHLKILQKYYWNKRN